MTRSPASSSTLHPSSHALGDIVTNSVKTKNSSVAAQMSLGTDNVQTWEYFILAVAMMTLILAIILLILRH